MESKVVFKIYNKNFDNIIYIIGDYSDNKLSEFEEVYNKLNEFSRNEKDFKINKKIIIINDLVKNKEDLEIVNEFIKSLIQKDNLNNVYHYLKENYNVFIIRDNISYNKINVFENLNNFEILNNCIDIYVHFRREYMKQKYPGKIDNNIYGESIKFELNKYTKLKFDTTIGGILFYGKITDKNIIKYFNNCIKECISHNDKIYLKGYIVFLVDLFDKESMFKDVLSCIDETFYLNGKTDRVKIIFISKNLITWNKGEAINLFIDSHSKSYYSFKDFVNNEFCKNK